MLKSKLKVLLAMHDMNQKQLAEGSAYLAHRSSSKAVGGQEIIQNRNPEAGADAEAMQGCCLLAWSSWFAQSAFL